MTLQISEETAAMISLIGEHMSNQDGTTWTTDAVVSWALGGLASVRPDIAAVLATEEK